MDFLKIPPWKYPSKSKSIKKVSYKDTLSSNDKDQRPFNWVLSDSLPLSAQSFNEDNQQFYDFLVNFLSANVFAPQNLDQISRLISILQYTIGFSFAREENLQKKLKRANSKLASVYAIASQQKQQIDDLKQQNRVKNERIKTMTIEMTQNANKPKYSSTEVKPKPNLPKIENDDLTVTILDQLNLRTLNATQRAEDDMALWMEKKFAKLESKIDQVQRNQSYNYTFENQRHTLQPKGKRTRNTNNHLYYNFDNLAKTVPPPPPPPIASSEAFTSEASPERVTIRKRISASPPIKRKRVETIKKSESSDNEAFITPPKEDSLHSPSVSQTDPAPKKKKKSGPTIKKVGGVIILSGYSEEETSIESSEILPQKPENKSSKSNSKKETEQTPKKTDKQVVENKQPDPKPAAKLDTKNDSKSDKNPEKSPDTKSETKKDSNVPPKSETKPEKKSDPKSEVKNDKTSDPKQEDTPKPKPVSKSDSPPEKEPENKSDPKIVPKPEDKNDKTSDNKPEPQPVSMSDSQPEEESDPNDFISERTSDDDAGPPPSDDDFLNDSSVMKPIKVTHVSDNDESSGILEPVALYNPITMCGVDLDEVIDDSEPADSSADHSQEIQFKFTPPPKAESKTSNFNKSAWKATDMSDDFINGYEEEEEENVDLQRNDSLSISTQEQTNAKPRQRGKQSFY